MQRIARTVGSGHRVVVCSLCVLAALVTPPPGFSKFMSGTVVDPQQLPVAGAVVSLDCGEDKAKTRTDVRGRFFFPRPDHLAPCLLMVSSSGFAPFKARIGGGSAPLKVALSIAPLRQALAVRGERPSPQRLERVGSVSLSRAELQGISNKTGDLISYARLLAGAPPGPDNIYVDGLPAKVLPPAEMISQITVNADPFSAEYSDGDQNRIEITTGSADRKLHFNLGGGSLGIGGNSVLAQGLHSSSSWASPSVTGPVPFTPLAFSLQGNFGSNWSQQLVQAVGPTDAGVPPGSSKVPSSTHSGSGSLNLYYSKAKSVRAWFSYSQSNVSAGNAGVGGLTVLEAGSGDAFASREARFFFEKIGERWVWHTGMAIDFTGSHLWANSTSQSLSVPGYFQAGGAPVSDQRTSQTNWTWKTVVQHGSQRRFWTSGISVSRAGDLESEIPNPNGELECPNLSAYSAALSGAPTCTLVGARGTGNAHYASTTAAPFLQAELWESQNSIVMGGVRADYQSGGGALFSPRLSAATTFHGFILRAGSGLFVHEWPTSVFVNSLIDDGVHLQQFIATGVPLPDNGGGLATAGVPVVSRISPDLVRPRMVMSKASIQRSMRNLTAGLEYTWTKGTHLLGSRRLPIDNGWMDLLESNRRLRKDEIHARVQYHWRRQSITGNYEWMHSHDDTDGPFSFPEFQDNIRGDWARSTGVPTHNASLVGNFSLPWAISITALGSWHSSSPFTILTGNDLEGDGLFNDRGGLARNSGNGPAYRSVSLYGYRHVVLNRLLSERARGFGFDVGVQADDVLANRNYLTLGSVVGSPLIGRPLAALPGPSVRLWFSFAP